jgi:hypothetical protein
MAVATTLTPDDVVLLRALADLADSLSGANDTGALAARGKIYGVISDSITGTDTPQTFTGRVRVTEPATTPPPAI